MSAYAAIIGALEQHGSRFAHRRDGDALAQCPAHADGRPSLHVTRGDGCALLRCYAGCDAGDITEALGITFAELFDRHYSKDTPTRKATKPAPSKDEALPALGELGAPTTAQTARLRRARRLREAKTLETLHVRRVRVWGLEWLLFPALGGAAKLWSADTNGNPMADSWRRNYGAVSVIVTPNAKDCARLYDVEGESDLLAALEAGLPALCSTGGAGSLAGHDRCREELLALNPREVVVLRDLDEAGRKGATKVSAWWHELGIPTRILELPEAVGPKGDLRDYLNGKPARGDHAAVEPLGDGAALQALADAAELPEPRAMPCALPDILDETKAFMLRFVAFSEEQAAVGALWVAHTHSVDAADTTPYLAVLSPAKRCGKTLLLDVLELLVARPWRAISPTEAVLFRKLEADAPTLLLDEADAVWSHRGSKENEGLRAALNAGFRRGSKVPRCEAAGKTFKLVEFETFGAKAVAAIGTLPDTVLDRSFIIRLERKAKAETVERFRRRQAEPLAEPIREALERWSAGAVPLLRDSEPHLPDDLNDRAQDSAEPLLAIADLAGGEWPARAREALLSIAKDSEEAEEPSIRLLSDIRRAFAAAGTEEMATAVLVEALTSDDELPWGSLTRGPLAGAGLARRLRKFGVRPRHRKSWRGYREADFETAWERYLPSPTSETSPRHLLNDSAHLGDSETSPDDASKNRNVTLKNEQKLEVTAAGDGVTFRLRGNGNGAVTGPDDEPPQELELLL